ncbi:hypothetical protein [Polaromonas glacialis]|uniref:hypothetical protein n=1 Tax=Polaromonas glacialis TaxID=866564 RepID=UPI001E4CCB30|nr:hypothetical protein [Polaromonas glacialis]
MQHNSCLSRWQALAGGKPAGWGKMANLSTSFSSAMAALGSIRIRSFFQDGQLL